MPKRKTFPSVVESGDGERKEEEPVADLDILSSDGKCPTRPVGTKGAIEEQKLQKQRDCAIRAQAKATAEMAAASSHKA
jgi:hypothetical protein